MVAPRVSILVTTRNGAAVIGPTLTSALNQRCADFEVVVVDDGSTDATPALLAARAQTDGRLRVLHNPTSLGVVGARNVGFAACRGTYVAALDHDDLSHPDRLAVQAAFLDAHPGVVLVGSGVRILTADGRLQATDHPTGITPTLLRWMLLTDNPLTWSSVMLRAAAVRRLGSFMREEFLYADDFDLYHRLLRIGDLARLDAVLTTYRWHAANTSHSRGAVLFEHAVRVLAEAYRPWFGPSSEAGNATSAAASDRVSAEAEAAARRVIRHCSDRQAPTDAAELDALGAVLQRVLAGFCTATPMSAADRAAVHCHAGRIWWRALRGVIRRGRPGLAVRLRDWPDWAGERVGDAAPWRPPVTDVALSVAAGLVRWVKHGLGTARGRA